jgi:glyoxylase-like metal-dependent hydrolase (beta-lactamase superfamily II)
MLLHQYIEGDTWMAKITSEIFQVGGGTLSSAEDAAIYLIRIGSHASLVDAGCGKSIRKVMANIRAHHVHPNQIEYLLLTHCHFDHTGGAMALRELTGCRIVAHEMDAGFLEDGDPGVTAASWYGQAMEPFPVDIKLTEKRQEIELGGRTIQSIHIPGHSPGSVAYLIESDGQKVLFAQDVHGPLHPSLLSNREDYARSLGLLDSLETDILCEGHYGIFRGKDQVSTFIRQFLE